LTDPPGQPSIRDHLANERTLLAWIRTAITVIGLGFLVDKLGLDPASPSWQGFAGIALVLLGALLGLAGGYSYLNARREFQSGKFRPTVRLHLAIVALVVIAGIALALVLILT
jgi:putative membrane protein